MLSGMAKQTALTVDRRGFITWPEREAVLEGSDTD
jgi:hypothetical protein